MLDPSVSASLILDFANTLDVEERTDVFSTVEGMAGWLETHELGDTAETAFADLLTLRAGLRARLLLDNDGQANPAEIAAAEAVLARAPLTVRIGGDPEPADPLRAEGAVAKIAAAWAMTVASGDWRRLKQCPDHECGWVFWDATRSRTRRWCSMRVCGNRAKVRAYTSRHRTDA
ncbi:CGNR zinc finger domain-containing protein [Phytomonospora sp. NPDC050363]|uniref:CGNR zinc finger domain-containing protein n=1 Tax=Phytomonospora sp. NPDC050363 TaxID=3155642 RepID=UPI0033D48C9B